MRKLYVKRIAKSKEEEVIVKKKLKYEKLDKELQERIFSEAVQKEAVEKLSHFNSFAEEALYKLYEVRAEAGSYFAYDKEPIARMHFTTKNLFTREFAGMLQRSKGVDIRGEIVSALLASKVSVVLIKKEPVLRFPTLRSLGLRATKENRAEYSQLREVVASWYQDWCNQLAKIEFRVRVDIEAIKHKLSKQRYSPDGKIL